MTTLTNFTGLVVMIGALATLLACGGGGSNASGAVDASASDSSSERMNPCELLTDEQVRTLVPDLKGSFVAARGESLIAGIESYQCSWVTDSGAGLTLVISVATDEKQLPEMKRGFRHPDDAQAIQGLGDEAWWYRGGMASEEALTLAVQKGRAVIELALDTKNAQQQVEPLTGLARSVAAKVP